ncbi:ribosome recycling factor family protein [Colwellia piezophila]|uniref:ribosome recycling factor family protein n=1 Tax=Colwellia piezophila TaxID=211668 RepID=UPI00036DE020|nr:ribosome recycling factor family protein [Colwellia piezophila]
MDVINTINLPAFIRRTMKAYALKAHIRQLGCELSRIGRSRNWQLKANFSQLQAIVEFIEHEHEDSWLWLAKLLRKEYKFLSYENILAVATRMDQVTVTALMAKTDCTLAQARKVLDALEGLD